MASTSKFAHEGGKLYLAEAFFSLYKYRLRCGSCDGNAGQPGYIKDQGGKASSDRTHRLWACQRSNGRSALDKCPRLTCTNYIKLADSVLDISEFRAVVEHVCSENDPMQQGNLALQGYRSRVDVIPASDTVRGFPP